MEKKNIIAGVIITLLIVGAVFVSANLPAEETKKTSCAAGECGASCDGSCGGSCGVEGCGCAKAATCGAGACGGDCGGSCGAKTCGCSK